MIDRDQQCPLFENCDCKSAVCRVSLPDKNCWYYRWFRDLIEEDKYREKVMCPNCKEEMYCGLDMTINTPWHFHCKKCDIDVGCDELHKAMELTQYCKPHTHIDFFRGKFQFVATPDWWKEDTEE